MVENTDVVVVGGGISGVAVAYHLAAGRDVVLLEAEAALATHTTGRSAALYAPSYGGPVVRRLTAASRARFDAMPETLEVAEPLLPRTVLHLGTDEPSTAGVRQLIAEHDPPLRVIGADDAARMCPALDPARVGAAALDEGASDIDVMGVHQGYLRGFRSRGGTVRKDARVTSIRRDGDRWEVTAGDARFEAGLVVNAAGAWADVVAEAAGVPPIGIRPLRRTIAISPLPGGGRPESGWPMVLDGAERFYFRPEGDGILFSPEDETPSEPTDAKPDEVDVALGLERVNAASSLGLRSVRTSWAGLRSFVADREPVVGEWAEHPGFCFYAAQGGYGIQMCPALAEAGAALALGEPIPEDIPVTAGDLSPRRLLG